jgi:hypothetical protein
MLTLPLRRRYRTVVLDRASFAVLTILDGLATNRQLTRALRQAWQYSCTVPGDNKEVNIPHDDGLPFVEEGVRLLLVLRRSNGDPPYVPVFAGELLTVQDRVDGDTPYADLVAYDPRQSLYTRPVYNADGNFPAAAGISYTGTVGSTIAAQLLARTIDADGGCYIDAGPDYGGTAFWGGTIEDTAPLNIDFQQGAMVGDAWDELEQTGSLDIILTPIYDPINRPGYLAELSIYTQAGSQRNDAIFSWDKFPRNLAGIGRLKDGTKRANSVAMFTSDGDIAEIASDSDSITAYGVSWATQTWPGQTLTDAVTALAALQLLLRKNGQETVTLQPAAEAGVDPIDDYQEGDELPVYASKRLRKPLAGLQRVWGMTIAPTDDDVETVTGMLVSADGTT